MLKALLATFTLPPKTLDQARATVDSSKAFAQSVTDLFSNAGLDLDTLLAAGPESLKAHLASLDNAEQIKSLTAQLATAQAAIDAKAGEVAAAAARATALEAIPAALGLPVAAAADAAAVAAALDTHVAKQVVLANAKAGHPPVQQIDIGATTAIEQLSDEAHLAAYEKLSGAEATAYLSAHSDALWRADITRRTRRS